MSINYFVIPSYLNCVTVQLIGSCKETFIYLQKKKRKISPNSNADKKGA
jgi:hypothetical protein